MCGVTLLTKVCMTEEYKDRDRSNLPLHLISQVNSLILVRRLKRNDKSAERNRWIPVTTKTSICQPDETKINGVCMKSYYLQDHHTTTCLPDEIRLINGICTKTNNLKSQDSAQNVNSLPRVGSRCLFCDTNVRLQCKDGFEWSNILKRCVKQVIDIDYDDSDAIVFRD